MADPVTNAEIEDVLSSIRRLVSDDARTLARARPATKPAEPDKLVLTPAQRVSEDAGDGLWNATSEPSAPGDLAATSGLREPAGTESTGEPAPHVLGGIKTALDFVASTESSEAAEAHPDALVADPWADPEATLYAAAAAFEEAGDAPDEEASETEVESAPEARDAGLTGPALGSEDDDAEAPESRLEPGSPMPDEEAVEAGPDEPADLPTDPEATLYAGSAAFEEAGDAPEEDASETEVESASEARDAGPTGPALGAGDDGVEAADSQAEPDLSVAVEAVSAAMVEADDAWEPDGGDAEELNHVPRSEVTGWQGWTAPDDGLAEAAAATAEDIVAEAVPDPDMRDPDTTGAEDETDAGETESLGEPSADSETILDEAALRELVVDIVREELQGVLGKRITRNVRKLIRREINRALSVQELE